MRIPRFLKSSRNRTKKSERDEKTASEQTSTVEMPKWQEFLLKPINENLEAPSGEDRELSFSMYCDARLALVNGEDEELTKLEMKRRRCVSRLRDLRPDMVERALRAHPIRALYYNANSKALEDLDNEL